MSHSLLPKSTFSPRRWLNLILVFSNNPLSTVKQPRATFFMPKRKCLFPKYLSVNAILANFNQRPGKCVISLYRFGLKLEIPIEQSYEGLDSLPSVSYNAK